MTIYAVNGKEPVAAWCPSLDTAGNGTTTLTDLSGNGNNGTLTNMDAATDWVADTGSGGVRALDFDGTNDYITFGNPSTLRDLHAGDFSFSAWCKSSVTRTNQTIFSSSQAGSGFFIRRNDSSSPNSLGLTVYFSTTNAEFTSSDGTFTINAWHHVAVVWDGTAKTAVLYVDGTAASSYSESVTGVGSPVSDASVTKELARLNVTGQLLAGRLDDIRLFTVKLDASDVNYLYNSGSGRGRVVEPAPTGVTYHPLSSRSTHPLRFSI